MGVILARLNWLLKMCTKEIGVALFASAGVG